MTAIWPKLRKRGYPDAKPVLAHIVGACWHGPPCLCRSPRLGEEAHHVMSDREPQQMDAGLDLTAQG